MTDREMLDLAAKAAGYVVRWKDAMSGGLYLADTRGIEWNPLEDDGDVLRLAVKTSILRRNMDLFRRFYDEEIAQGRQPAEATRRAFVRVAAEIGRAMP